VLANNNVDEVGGDKSLVNLLILNAAVRTALKDTKVDLKDPKTLPFPIDELLEQTSKLPVVIRNKGT
jgi:hypothetical protein